MIKYHIASYLDFPDSKIISYKFKMGFIKNTHHFDNLIADFHPSFCTPSPFSVYKDYQLPILYQFPSNHKSDATLNSIILLFTHCLSHQQKSIIFPAEFSRFLALPKTILATTTSWRFSVALAPWGNPLIQNDGSRVVDQTKKVFPLFWTSFGCLRDGVDINIPGRFRCQVNFGELSRVKYPWLIERKLIPCFIEISDL